MAIDIGPGAGDAGGKIVTAGPLSDVASHAESRTAPYLARALRQSQRHKRVRGIYLFCSPVAQPINLISGMTACFRKFI